MHYLVTGGCGFIGSHLVEHLLRGGHRVTVLDDLSTGKRDNIPTDTSLVTGDITTPGIFDPLVRHVDGCFHLAAIASVERSRNDWQRTHQVNLGGAIALFEAIARAKKPIPVVFASSAAVYGDCPDMPLTEASACAPISAYGVDKLACEWHARVASHLFHIPTLGLRFFNIYGPRQDPSSPYSGVISIFTARMKQHAPVTIYGDGEQSRDFVFVGDVVKALEAGMHQLHQGALRYGVCNVCAGTSISINTLAQTLARLTDTRSAITHAPARDGDIRQSLGDASIAKRMLNVSPCIALEDGLRQTLESL